MIGFLHVLAYCTAALFLLTLVGNVACQKLLAVTGLRQAVSASSPDVLPAGRIIGWLERLVIAVGLISDSWEVLAAVIALKTISRFKELDEKLPAEYFLIGSLFSILWAMIVTGGWMTYDGYLGLDVHGRVAAWIGGDGSP